MCTVSRPLALAMSAAAGADILAAIVDVVVDEHDGGGRRGADGRRRLAQAEHERAFADGVQLRERRQHLIDVARLRRDEDLGVAQ